MRKPNFELTWQLAITTTLTIISGVIVNILGLFEGYCTSLWIPCSLFYALLACLAFLLLLGIVHITWNQLALFFFGEDIEFPKGESKIKKFKAMYARGDKSEISIFLPITNRNKHMEILAHAKLEQFECVYYAGTFIKEDETSKAMRKRNLLLGEEPRLRWKNFEYETTECEMKIPPQEERWIEVARFIFLLKQSYDQNTPMGVIGLYFCKNPNPQEPNSKEILGLYKIKVAVKYKIGNDNAVRTKVFDGYIYASIKENHLEDDIRDRLEGEVIIGSGDPMKNKDIPKPRDDDMNKFRKSHAR